MHVLWETDRWLQKFCVSNSSEDVPKIDESKGTAGTENKAVASGGGAVAEFEDTGFDGLHFNTRSSLW